MYMYIIKHILIYTYYIYIYPLVISHSYRKSPFLSSVNHLFRLGPWLPVRKLCARLPEGISRYIPFIIH